jgi:transcriptional regulator with XRE-family HTH domain
MVEPVGDEIREELDPGARLLSDNIRTERLYVGLNQAQVAEHLGVTRAAVSALETGRRRVSALELKRLAQLFGTSVDRLVGRDVPEDPTVSALFRAAKDLSTEDKEQVLRFAEFLKGVGVAPDVGQRSSRG